MATLISLVCLSLSIMYRRYFVLVVPILPLAGYALMSQHLLRNMQFVTGYAELLILISFTATEMIRAKDSNSPFYKGRTFIFLLLYPLLSIPGLLFALAHGYFFYSLFITILLSLSAFLYRFYVKNMQWMLKRNLVDSIVLVWIISGLLAQIYFSVRYGSLLRPSLPSLNILFYGMLFRGGYIWGSNHIGGIILPFLPLIENPWLLLLSNIFLLTTFSRGVYALLLIFWLFRFFSSGSKERINIMKIFLLIFIIMFFVWYFLPKGSVLINFAFERLIGSKYWGQGITARFLGSISHDGRLDIWRESLRMLKETWLQGVGIGGFYWGESFIGNIPQFSNAHNLYLTILSEGGIFFFLAFVILLLNMFYLAFKYSKPILLSLFMIVIYGFYSGEIYETSNLVSACDYYYLLFFLALLEYKAHKSIFGAVSKDEIKNR